MDDVVAFYKKTFPEKLKAASRDARGQADSDHQLLRHDELAGRQFIGFANNHSIHHRGQLAAYLRAMGSKVPNIYGPSADAEG